MLHVLINSKSYSCLVLVAKTFNFLLATYYLKPLGKSEAMLEERDTF